jgi:glycosyltransferase involved in cell wall biosynthesis
MGKSSKKLLLIGYHSKGSVTGVSIAFDMLVSELKRRKIAHRIVDMSLLRRPARVGSFDASRAIQTARLLLSFWRRLPFVRVVYVTISSSLFGFLRDALVIWSARALSKRLVVHLHGGGYSDFYATQPKWVKAFIGRSLRQADRIIVLGELLRCQFDFVPGASRKIRVVPNGLPAGLYPDLEKSKSLPKGGVLRILYLSNMIESKGYLDVIEACRILRNCFRVAIQCDLCGEFVTTVNDRKGSSSRASYEQFLKLIERDGLGDCVAYHGGVSGKRKQELLESAHVFVLPTFYAGEGQPISIIEALAFGTPVIATGYRGIPEQVIDGFNGFLVAPHAPQEIAEAVKKLAGDSGLYTMLSRNSISQFRKKFTQEAHLDRLISVISEDY